MTEALYRKYRPTTFEDVTDQNHVKITLKNQLANGTVSHAYVFSGPRGVGKTTIARLLAKALNCQNRKPGDSEPCNACNLCNEMNSGKTIDIIEIDAASHTGVDNVRENIIENVRFAPNIGMYKVFIIDEVHMLSTSAFNALLKTLEEPPKHAIFILATTEVHKIPQTILSRCQRFDFHRIATPEMIVRLMEITKAEDVEVAEPVLAQIARLSEGCLRDAESLLGQILALGEKKIGVEEASIILPVTNTATVVNLVDAIVRKDANEVIRVLNDFVDQGGSVRHLIDETIEFVRNMMFVGLGSTAHDHYDADTMQRMRQFLESFTTVDAGRLLDVLLAARTRPSQESLPQLPLEIGLILFLHGPASASAPAPVLPKVNPPTPPAPVKPSSKPSSPKPVAKAEAKPEAPSVESSAAPDASLRTSFPLDEMKDKWKRCCEAVAKRSLALPLALQKAEPSRVGEGEVEIAFAYQFHFDTFSDIKNLKILTDAVNEVMQAHVRVVPVYKHQAEEEIVAGLVDAFGGQVIE